MKSFYEFIQLLKENEQASGMLGQSPENQPRTGEDRRRHFGIQGTGGGRTDDEVIYNNLSVNGDGYSSGQMIVWFNDENDLDKIGNDTNEVVRGYGDVSSAWNFKYNFTVVLTDNPSMSYPPRPNGSWPINLPNSHGSGIVKIEIKDVEERPDEGPDYDRDDYNPDPNGRGYWDRYWSTGPGRDQ
jgi:hypothetical protein